MDIRYLSYLSFCHAIPKLRSYCDQKLKLSLKFSYKYWTHCKTLSKTIQSLYFSLIFIFQSLKLEFERLSIFQKFSESFTKYLIRTFIHFNWSVWHINYSLAYETQKQFYFYSKTWSIVIACINTLFRKLRQIITTII